MKNVLWVYFIEMKTALWVSFQKWRLFSEYTFRNEDCFVSIHLEMKSVLWVYFFEMKTDLWVSFQKWRLFSEYTFKNEDCFVSIHLEMKSVLWVYFFKWSPFVCFLKWRLLVSMLVEMKSVCAYASRTESCWWLCVSNRNYLLACFLKLKLLLNMPLSLCELNSALDEVKMTPPSLVSIHRNTWLHNSVFVLSLFLPRNVQLV
jgi:hypothetical protein